MEGFAPDAVAELSKAAEKLEACIDGRVNLRVRRAGSTKGISEEVKRGHAAVKTLNAVIGGKFAKARRSWRRGGRRSGWE